MSDLDDDQCIDCGEDCIVLGGVGESTSDGPVCKGCVAESEAMMDEYC